VARALLARAKQLGVPGVAAPSANRFGRVSPTTAAHVLQEFGPALLVLDGGACDEGIESAIIDLTGASPRLLRPGSVERSVLAAALGGLLDGPVADSPRVPGALASHYAPSATVEVVSAAELPARVTHWQARLGPGAVAVWARTLPAGLPPECGRRMPDNAREAARSLFATLRDFDAAGRRAICVELPPEEPSWDGVRDRLFRAAAPR
jgi:L-threonylcarbamoyladenylate synthase